MQSRKDFLAAGALAALVPQMASAQEAPVAPAPTSTPDGFPPLNFDLKAFDASLESAATHRHLFASTKISDYGLEAIHNTLNAYEDVGVASTDVLPAAVFYHGFSVLIGFSDAVWNQLIIPAQARMPKKMREDLGTYKANSGNPYLHAAHPDTRDSFSIEKLIARSGARFYVCNNATRGMSHALGGMLSLKPADVYERLSKSLVPNAMLVPAGVWAVHAVQERHFTLLQATV